MGARQSKRSVDISSTPKKGELENGAVAGPEEKLEKIEEGESAATKVNANGSTTTTSTVTAEQQEAAASEVVTETSAATAAATESTPSKPAASVTEATSSEKVTTEEPSTPTATSTTEEAKQEVSSPASPSEAASPEEGGSEKKKSKKKKWSFRSFSFSKKDKQKPASKEEKQQETVPEGNENPPQAEQVTPEVAAVATVQSVRNENPPQAEQVTPEVAAVATVQSVQNEEPPPLPTSPPPTPADEVPVAPVVAPVEKEETPTISEGDVEASGGGEGLAEPIEDGELEESTKTAPVAPAPVVETPPSAPLTNGTNGVIEMNGKHSEEDEELISPVCERKSSVDLVTSKIGSIKLNIVSDSAEAPAQNGVEEPVEMNGIGEKCDSALEKAVVEN